MNRTFISALLLATPGVAAAQMTNSSPSLSESEEIAMARSAAPAQVSGEATIYALRDGRYEVAVEGTSGVSCMVSRSLPLSMEPICYDAEASRTILPIEQRRVEMRLSGVATEEIERHIAEAIGTGELTVPGRPAMAYMMSSSQVLYANEDTPVGSWYPHIHIYMPYATAEQFGLYGDPSTEAALVDEAGTPLANMIITVREFTSQE